MRDAAWGGEDARVVPPKNDAGSLTEDRDAATLSVGGGLHYDWAYLTQAPIAFFVRYELMWEMPYAQGFSEVIPYHVMSLGLRFTPLRKKPRRWAEKSGGR